MKKALASVLAVLLFLSTFPGIQSRNSMKVLVDESRLYGWDSHYQDTLIEKGASKDTNWNFSFASEEIWAFSNAAEEIRSVASLDIKKSGTLSYSVLRDYDVLIIASFEESYSSIEMDAVRQFVENGGGLLMLADTHFPHNSFSRTFDVAFPSQETAIADKNGVSRTFRYKDWNYTLERYLCSYVDDIENHPVTKGVDRIALVYGVPITHYESGTVLARTGTNSWADTLGRGEGSKQHDEEAGPFDILLVMENVGKGRAVFAGSSISFWNAVTQDEPQNLRLLSNAVKWLGELGGPYKQCQAVNEQAKHIVAEATSLYDNQEFSEAKTKFEEALAVFEQSKKIRPNADAQEGIEDAVSWITKCDIGVQAERTYNNAMSLFAKREYEKAIEEFKKAKPLYDEIGCTVKAAECATKIDESTMWIALRDKATHEFQQAEESLSTAPSGFNAAGYEKAKSLFMQARSSWEEYDDPAQVRACEEYIAQCEKERGEIKNRVIMVEATAIVLVALTVVIVFMRGHGEKTR
jgi:tetratricopeptide (TPR) repeat protein